MSKQGAHVPELGPEAAIQQKKSVKPNEKVYTGTEHERHQAPIQEALEPEDAVQFKWIAETGNIQSYQHTETGRNIHIDGKTAQFYSQEGKPASQEAALDRAMPEGRSQPQNEYEQGLGIGL